jgi:hypothetical protein
MDALHKLDDGNLVLETPPDSKSGATAIALDRPEKFANLQKHPDVFSGDLECLIEIDWMKWWQPCLSSGIAVTLPVWDRSQ